VAFLFVLFLHSREDNLDIPRLLLFVASFVRLDVALDVSKVELLAASTFHHLG
jgi:hypothetical protein